MPDNEEIAMESTEVDTPEISTEEVIQEPVGDYTVKIDGAEHQVTLDELQQGYQRQADYTRKTQELASERERLNQAEAIVSALDSDPEGTVTALAEAYGVQTNRQQTNLEMDEYEEVDPVTQRLQSLEAKLAVQERASRQQALAKQVEGLKDQYGDFDEKQLYQHALKNKIPNLEAAFTHMNYGEVAAVAEKLQSEQEITESKRQAGNVSGGKSTQSSAVVSNAPEKVGSLRDAFALAKQQLGQ
jgi:hypothetical protein